MRYPGNSPEAPCTVYTRMPFTIWYLYTVLQLLVPWTPTLELSWRPTQHKLKGNILPHQKYDVHSPRNPRSHTQSDNLKVLRPSPPQTQSLLSANGVGRTEGRSTMKLCPQAVLVVVASSFAYTVLVLGLKCGSNCSACWKDGDTTGVDTKFSCDRDQCGDACPTGYHDMHCARSERCL